MLEAFVARGEEAAFESLVRRHGPMVLGVCRRVLQNHHDAEEAFQATFLVLARRASSVRPRHMVGSWLHGVARRAALQARAVRQKRQSRETSLEPGQEPAAGPSAIDTELLSALDEELGGLPDRYRVAIVFCDLEGRKQSQVARQLGWPAGTLACRLARGRKLLARRLIGRGFALPATGLGVFLSGRVASAAPASLMELTLSAAKIVAAGGALTSVVSSETAVLTNEVLKAMCLTKLKAVSLSVLAVVAIATLVAAPLSGPFVQPARANERPLPEVQPAPMSEAVGTFPLRPAAAAPQPKPATNWEVRRVIFLPANDQMCSMAFSADGQKVATGGVLKGRVWDAATGKEVVSVAFPGQDPIASLAFSPDGTILAGAPVAELVGVNDSRSAVILWDAKTGRELAKLDEHENTVHCLAFSPDGKTLASGSGQTESVKDKRSIRLWDVREKKERDVRIELGEMVLAVAFSPDGKTLAVGLASGEVKFFDAATGKRRASWKAHTDWVMSLAFSPDGKALAASCRDGNVKLWDADAGKERGKIDCHTGSVRLDKFVNPNVRQIAFSPNGKTLVTTHEQDKAVKVWDVTEPDVAKVKCVQTIEDHTGAIRGVAFDRKGILATGGNDAVRLWEPKPEK